MSNILVIRNKLLFQKNVHCFMKYFSQFTIYHAYSFVFIYFWKITSLKLCTTYYKECHIYWRFVNLKKNQFSSGWWNKTRHPFSFHDMAGQLRSQWLVRPDLLPEFSSEWFDVLRRTNRRPLQVKRHLYIKKSIHISKKYSYDIKEVSIRHQWSIQTIS